ncbi:MAG: FGGY family carbohydrate kinase [Clostridia bacterium]
MPYILIYDVGTSSLKLMLYDKNGEVIFVNSYPYEYATPKVGWAEINPQKWEQALWKGLDEIAAKFALSELVAIAGTGQMHTVILLDEQQEVLEPCILWLDRRADQETVELQEMFSLPPYVLNSTYSLPKLFWLNKNMPEVVAKTKKILWAKDYIRFLLNGVISTDATEGLGAGLLNWETSSWEKTRLMKIGWNEDVLPQILPADAGVGKLKNEIAEKYSINKQVKILTSSGDILALLGGAPHKKGRLVYSLGTSSMFFTLVEKIMVSKCGGLYTLALAGLHLFGGVSSTTGAALTWCKEKLWGEISWDEMLSAAWKVEAGKEGLIFIPYLAGERSPYWSDQIAGGFYGLTLEHDKRHLTRAVLEGVAFSVKHMLDLYKDNGVDINEIALAGGGVKTKGWGQLIADVCGVNVVIFTGQETVGNAVFAISKSSIGKEKFNDILAGMFNLGVTLIPNDDRGKELLAAYQNFRKFSQFAIEIT